MSAWLPRFQAEDIRAAAVSLLCFLSISLGIAVLHLGVVNLGENFHAVIAGEVYRSAQPTPERIDAYRRHYGIRTIINLRGDNTGSPWYDGEVAESARLGIAHVDFRMSAKRQMTDTQFGDLMEILRTAEKPILIHCTSGADRTGLVSALYLAGVAKEGEERSEDQISFRYGHVPFWFMAAHAMDSSFEARELALGFPNS
jgi:protein tyrosine/serine phosphatase